MRGKSENLNNPSHHRVDTIKISLACKHKSRIGKWVLKHPSKTNQSNLISLLEKTKEIKSEKLESRLLQTSHQSINTNE